MSKGNTNGIHHQILHNRTYGKQDAFKRTSNPIPRSHQPLRISLYFRMNIYKYIDHSKGEHHDSVPNE
jgi:hypothetical protein